MSLIDSIKDKAGDILNGENVNSIVDKAKDLLNTEEGKEKFNEIKDKVEDFVEEKTNGKGIFGFGDGKD